MIRVNTLILFLLTFLSGLVAFADPPVPAPRQDRVIEPGTYQIRNQKYRQLLRPEDANNANGTRLVLYSPQPWKCMTWKLQPAGESGFRLQNYFTAKTFAADSNTNQTQQAVVQVPLAKDTGELPKWQFTKLADGSYRITEVQSGEALTAIEESGGHQRRVVIEP